MAAFTPRRNGSIRQGLLVQANGLLRLCRAQESSQPQPHRENTGRRIQGSGRRRRHELAGLVREIVHRDGVLVVGNRAGVVLQIVLLMDATLHVFPGVAGLRDIEEIPIDAAFEIKRIGDRIVRIGLLIGDSGDVGRL